MDNGESAENTSKHGRSAMTQATAAAALAMFGAPFLLLAACYAALPDELSVLRILLAPTVLYAPKTLFTVFRVPLMNLTHGIIAAAMLSHTPDFRDAQRRASYSRVFSTLLFAVAFKSNFEALEMSGLARSFGTAVPWLTYGTVVSIIGGLVIALVYARGVPFPWPELRLRKLEKIMLAFLFAAYLGIVTGTLLVAHRGGVILCITAKGVENTTCFTHRLRVHQFRHILDSP
jgi:hypothetical protein